MKNKKTGYFIVISLLFTLASFSYGASEDTRYFVKSNSGSWKKFFGVRHNFANGFTADIGDNKIWQIKFAGIFGVEVEPVKKLYVLPAEQASEVSAPRAKPSPVRPVPSDQIPWGIEAVYNNSLISNTSGGRDVKVAVLDTGVLKTHPDLKNVVKECKDFTSFKQPIIDGSCDDKNGHGTHVVGIIAADGGSDGKGIFGVAPEADIMAYKVCGTNGSCWADDIASALRTAADNGANVLNMSLDSDTPIQLITDAINYAVDKGVLVIAAAGNDGPYFGSIDYPGAYESVIAVGAIDSDNDIPEWSSRGINSTTEPYSVQEQDIEFAAPGVDIESAWKDGGYAKLSGTSMATPHVAGLAAKLWQKDAIFPLIPAVATRELLHTFSSDIGVLSEGGLPVDDDDSGWGLPHL